MKTSYIQETLPGLEEYGHEIPTSAMPGDPRQEMLPVPLKGPMSVHKTGNFSCQIDNLNQFEKLAEQSGMGKEEFLNHVLNYIGTLNRVSKYSSHPNLFTSLGKQIYKLINRKREQEPMRLIRQWEA